MRILIGKIISQQGDKTAKVVVERIVVHPIYKKRFRRMRKYLVHNETGAKIGDLVKFIASRPYSKFKKWRIIK
ncbi:MAG: 30S ribosomal protein S17 [Candidatus Woesebacteria bacterium GW2011_GWB1_41_10]|uniref:30S ribosomal protein S17 n=1 Tax=Candidatus Woesebacteria bacterium GW2011_GWB1_41_10 TaxID=1618577 RepID=A0A0G0UFJ3_9BACT|nr:MAG: 30S ribosomal protein S17 [Candidatus Woesebacteria bacterium GW2011_GWB1_41_10]